MASSDKEKLFCSNCRYETDYLGTYQKPPVCPTCKNLLSFKNSSPVNPDEAESVPWVSITLQILAVLFLAVSLGLIFRNFQTYDSRALVKQQVRVGEEFYGGPSKSKIAVDWIRIPYSYETYFKNAVRGRYFMMTTEEHRYIYKGGRAGQITVEYFYSNVKAKKGRHVIQLAGPVVYLDIPAIPYVKGSRAKRLKLVQDTSGSRLSVTELS